MCARGCQIADACRPGNAAYLAAASCEFGSRAEYAILQEKVALPPGYELIGHELMPACSGRG
ncbi:unnamed protein product [marine sediment metagenome]|uniref:Uncharacterized protein n=1 Tax=marine sediment metagenome TaxID=412755 RepID=X0WK50_9ZZZZ